jgi:hypothetical protein
MLMKLPNMTEDVADAIVDWIDTNTTIRPAGAESEEYAELGYRCKDGPITSIEELLLVRGVTPELLFGSDRNRNGIQDANEVPTQEAVFSRGWSEYLTCYGRELNVDKDGNPRVFLGNQDIAALSEELTTAVGQELSDYIVYFIITGNSENVPAMLPDGQAYTGASSLRDIVQAALDAGTASQRRNVSSLMSLYNTQIRLPRPMGAQPEDPTLVVACPFNGADNLKTALPILLDRCTTTEDYDMLPRINVSTAPYEVLMALTGIENGITEEDVSNIVASRPQPGADLTAGWLVTSANVPAERFRNIERYVTGVSGAYRVHSVGYTPVVGGPSARVEAVIETIVHVDDTGYYSAKPRIVYFRDLSELGRGFNDLPR